MEGSPWWLGGTIYHAYVRSFRDSDGDGHGDLGGLIQGLDYLQWLGIRGLWLSPTMPSPNRDWGYDVSDYLGVHPELGSMQDLDLLIAEAASRGIRIVLDLVANHTSDEHPWFVQSRTSTSSRFRDYYVWADGDTDGSLPNNWVDDTGEPAWTWDETAGQYYLHNFLDAQPDLNWWAADVHREFDAILNFWFDRGIAGFRIDVANGLYKDAGLRDNPRHPDAHIYGKVQGRYGLQHVHNFNQPEVHEVYRSWRRLAESRTEPRLLMGETWVATVEELGPYYGADDELQLALNFPLIFTPFQPEALAAVVAESIAAFPAGACPVWTGSNHDLPRMGTRWGGDDPRKLRLAQTILAMLPGTFVLYYGDELGMLDSDIPTALQRDPLTAGGLNGQWPRDNARAPMRWTPAPEGGFSTAIPWLPIHPDSGANVESHQADTGSTLTLTRQLIALHAAHLSDPAARYRQVSVSQTHWVFESGRLTVLANFSDVGAELAATGYRQLSSIDGIDPAVPGPSGAVCLGPWEAVVLLRDPL
jgi:alpha-glucosidase